MKQKPTIKISDHRLIGQIKNMVVIIWNMRARGSVGLSDGWINSSGDFSGDYYIPKTALAKLENETKA